MKNKLSTIVSALLLSGSVYAKDINIVNGWQMKGSDSGFTNMNAFNKSCIETIWSYDTANNRWKAYSPNISKQNIINNNTSVMSLSSLNESDGFWVNANSDCVIDGNITNSTTGQETTVVYSEDFSSNPNFISNNESIIYWDDIEENYYAESIDVSSGIGKYVGLSPTFKYITPLDTSFSIEFDFNPVKPDFGSYPFISFIDNNIFKIDGDKLEGKSFQVVNSYENQNGKKIRFNTTNGVTEVVSSITTSANTWYHVNISYNHISKTIDILILNKTDNSIYLKIDDLNGDNLGNFNQIFIGGWAVPPKYGSNGIIKVDNIIITK
ncbi:MAG: hypothetical protein U9Q30_02155 [Campylobacterota bacterium]|nr:hypothetical protein [Campylobacterota bacterium]